MAHFNCDRCIPTLSGLESSCFIARYELDFARRVLNIHKRDNTSAHLFVSRMNFPFDKSRLSQSAQLFRALFQKNPLNACNDEQGETLSLSEDLIANLPRALRNLIGSVLFNFFNHFDKSGCRNTLNRQVTNNGVNISLQPSLKSSSRDFEVFHPINRNAGQQIEAAIFSHLNDVLKNLENNAGYSRADTA